MRKSIESAVMKELIPTGPEDDSTDSRGDLKFLIWQMCQSKRLPKSMAVCHVAWNELFAFTPKKLLVKSNDRKKKRLMQTTGSHDGSVVHFHIFFSPVAFMDLETSQTEPYIMQQAQAWCVVYKQQPICGKKDNIITMETVWKDISAMTQRKICGCPLHYT